MSKRDAVRSVVSVGWIICHRSASKFASASAWPDPGAGDRLAAVLNRPLALGHPSDEETGVEPGGRGGRGDPVAEVEDPVGGEPQSFPPRQAARLSSPAARVWR